MLGRKSIPLLAEEGWREARGWSVRRNVRDAGLTASLDGCALSGLRGLRPPSAPLRWLRNIFLPHTDHGIGRGIEKAGCKGGHDQPDGPGPRTSNSDLCSLVGSVDAFSRFR